MQYLSLETLLPYLQRDFFIRVALASMEVIRLLHTQDSILHDSFGVGAGGDLSSGADLLAESIFCKFLLPHYHIDSEESGFISGGEYAKDTIVLDPLDGSSNFKSNIPYYGASIALCDSFGKVSEACVVNYISQEIAYLSDDLLSVTKMPCVFSLQTLITELPLESMNSEDSVHIMQRFHSIRSCYTPFDFTFLLKHDKMATKDDKIACILDSINATENLPIFDSSLLYAMFASQILIYRPQKIITEKLGCGIFENAMQHAKWVSFLTQNGLKFRSLGAIALSLAFSFRYLFVFLPTQVRKYDGMAGFYLAQNQYIYGNVQAYCEAIPYLQQCKDSVSHIVITTNSKIIDILKGR